MPPQVSQQQKPQEWALSEDHTALAPTYQITSKKGYTGLEIKKKCLVANLRPVTKIWSQL